MEGSRQPSSVPLDPSASSLTRTPCQPEQRGGPVSRPSHYPDHIGLDEWSPAEGIQSGQERAQGGEDTWMATTVPCRSPLENHPHNPPFPLSYLLDEDG